MFKIRCRTCNGQGLRRLGKNGAGPLEKCDKCNARGEQTMKEAFGTNYLAEGAGILGFILGLLFIYTIFGLLMAKMFM